MDPVSFVTMTMAILLSSHRSLCIERIYIPRWFLSVVSTEIQKSILPTITITYNIASRDDTLYRTPRPTMSSLSIEAPQLMEVTGDNCASCGSLSVPLYDLSCHESDEFHCRDCLTKSFYSDADEVVRCPHPTCRQPAGFQPLDLREYGLHLNNDFYDEQRIDKIREQPEVMNNLIAFTRDEAEVTFTIYLWLGGGSAPGPCCTGRRSWTHYGRCAELSAGRLRLQHLRRWLPC
jgi:hypothetical protein